MAGVAVRTAVRRPAQDDRLVVRRRVRGAVPTFDGEAAMPGPDCPRCGSALVVAAAAATPSESVLELRSGIVRVDATEEMADHHLCRACGHRWDAAGDGSEPRAATETPEPLEAAPAPAPAAGNPAAELRVARERRGRTLVEVSSGTRIPVRHLRALERDAPLEAFPAPAYARFFLREYAEYLDLDPDPLLQGFEARHAPVEEPPPPPARRSLPRDRARGWGVLVVLSVVAIAAIAIVPSVLRSDEQPGFVPPAAASSPAHDSGHEPLPPRPAREPDGLRAVLRVSQPSWVQAVADGEVVEAATLEQGTVVTYRADGVLELTLGNAGGVRLQVNGDPVPTGTPGEVVNLGFAWRDGEVRTRP
jgi:cytoskeleton protein RodZ